MAAIANKIKVLTGIAPDNIPEQVINSVEPLLLKSLVAKWPIVKKAEQSPELADLYIRQFYQGATVDTCIGAPQIKGRISYNENLTALNFQRGKDKLSNILDQIQQHKNEQNPPSFYVGSTTLDLCLPGFQKENALNLKNINPLVSIWIGNQSRIAAHYDVPDNIACVVVGRRRFTLFPPEQLVNLYVGPIDFTPAGQPVSLVDFHNPDFKRYPKFREALKAALIVDLEPGDALFLPGMWWHHVEALDDFNVLVNYWWRQVPAYMGQPINVLHHALLSIRGLPPEQKKAWQGIFEHYIFNSDADTLSHIPEHSLGSLGPLNDSSARQLRAMLLNKLNR